MPTKKAAPPATKRTTKSASADKQAGTDKPARRVVEVPKPKRNIPVVGIVFGVITVLLVAAILLTANTGPGNENGEPTVTGDFLPVFGSTVGDPAVGLPAPVLAGENFAGDPVTIEANGTPTAIAFIAHWCPHCQQEVPRVQQWLDAGGGVDGVEIVSVSTSVNSARENFPPSRWLDNAGWTPEVLKDDTDSSAHVAFGAGGFPYWVFLNADGTVAARSAGQLDIATLEQFLLTIAQ